jgi:hypothetical protein
LALCRFGGIIQRLWRRPAVDHADRIPIDVGYQVAADAGEQSQRLYILTDGTLSDYPQCPATAPAPSTEPEIVVCAKAPDDQRIGALPRPETPNPMKTIREALTVNVGPVEIGPGGVDGGAGFSARMKF